MIARKTNTGYWEYILVNVPEQLRMKILSTTNKFLTRSCLVENLAVTVRFLIPCLFGMSYSVLSDSEISFNVKLVSIFLVMHVPCQGLPNVKLDSAMSCSCKSSRHCSCYVQIALLCRKGIGETKFHSPTMSSLFALI